MTQSHHVSTELTLFYPLWWLFLAVNFPISGMSYNPEGEGTPVIWIWRKEDNTPLVQILRWEGTPLILATPSAESLYNENGRTEALCLPALALPAHPSLHWH